MPTILSVVMEESAPIEAAAPPEPRATSLPGRMLAFLRREPHWLWLIIPYAVAWWLPLAWSWERWGNPRSATVMQMFVPLLAGLLAWSRREELAAAWARSRSSSRRGFWQRGNASLLIVGCFLLLFSHIVHIKLVAILGLLLIAVGAAYWLFGAAVIKAAWIPILFSLQALPPPDSLLDGISRRVQEGTLTATKSALALVNIPTVIDNRGFIFFEKLGYSVEIKSALNPLGLIVPTFTLILFLALYRRYTLKQGVSLLIMGTVISALLSIGQCVVVSLLYRYSPQIGEYLMAGGPILPQDWVDLSGNLKPGGFFFVFCKVVLGVFWLTVSVGLTLFAGRSLMMRTDKLARPTGAVVNRMGRGINVVLAPVVALLNSLGQIGKVFKRSERGLEELLKRLFPKRRKRGW